MTITIEFVKLYVFFSYSLLGNSYCLENRPQYPLDNLIGFTLIENDHLGNWSPEKDCRWQLMFQPVQKPSSESRMGFDGTYPVNCDLSAG